MTETRRRPARHLPTMLATALLLAIAITMMAGAPASAGTYTMNQCQADPARAVSVNWGLFGNW